MNLNIVSACNRLGYGYVGSYLIQELAKLYKLSYFPIGNIQCEPKFVPFIQSSLKNAELFDPTASSIRIFHEFSLDLFPGKGKKIGFPFFEINKFSDKVKHHIQQCDQIFVASKWAKQIVLDQTSHLEQNVSIVHLGVDLDIFYPTKKEYNQIIFCNISKWESRKGHDLIPEAFKKAFSTEKVELWMMCDNPFLTEKQNLEWQNYYLNKLGNKVKFISRVATHEELAKIINLADIGLFPSRAEAWNLEIGEFLACGKTVISTNYSGMTEYLNKNNALLLEPNGFESMIDGIWFDGTSSWASIKIDDLVDLLRLAYNNHSFNQAGIDTMKELTWEKTALNIYNLLS